MNSSFAPYIDLYVYRKKSLFPLIESYSGRSVKGLSHGEVVSLYVDLLKTDDSFKNEVHSIINGFHRNSGGTAGNLALSLFPGSNSGSTGTTTTTRIQGPIASIVSSIGDAVGSIFGASKAKTEQENILYGAILAEQQKNDTGKIILISVITIAFIGVGAWFVVKMNKNK